LEKTEVASTARNWKFKLSRYSISYW